MEETMTTLTFRSITCAASLAALIAASTSAGAQPTYKHKAHIVLYTALVDDPAPAVATVSHGRGAVTEEIFSRNAGDCNKMLCLGY
jgi:hypothetical protein